MDEKLDKLEKTRQNILEVPLNKRDIKRIAAKTVLLVTEGDENPLEVDIKLRYLAEMIEQIRGNEEMKEAILGEADKYPEKSFDAYGAKITKTSVGTRYDYSECKYEYYIDVLEEIKKLNVKKKECEKLLQGLTDDMVVEETGEVIHPPVKTSKEGIRVQLL